MEASRTPWLQAPGVDDGVLPVIPAIPGEGVREKASAWAAKALALGAAALLGTVVTMGIFVILPPPGGETRFDARRRAAPARNAGTGDGFELFGPFRNTSFSVAFSWPILGDTLFDSYEVHYSKDPEFTPGRGTLYVAPIKHPSMTSIEVSGLDCASTYYFKVRKNDRNGRFSDSRELAARTVGCPDTTRFEPIQYAALYSEYEDDYYRDDPQVEPFDDSGDGTNDIRSEADPYSESGSGSRSSSSRSNDPVRLYPASYVGTGSAHVLWSDDYSEGFVAYEVHVSNSAGLSPSGSTRRAEFRNRYRTRFALDDLRCGEAYYVVIRARYDDGTVRDSNVERFTTQACGSSRPSAAGLGH